MRLLIKLKSNTRTKVIFPYYIQVQGLIYGLLKNTKFEELHSKGSYKFFCFSNIFPEKSSHSGFFEKNQIYNLIVSSPNKDFLKILAQKFIEREEVKISQNIFDLREVKFFNPSLKENLKIVSVSPIIIRIPKEKYQEYGISLKTPYPSLFWRPKYPFEAFIKQLEDNIFKKYKGYYQEDIKEFPIFQKFFFKKSVSLPIKIHGKKVNFIGSLWEFHFDFLAQKTRNILEFGLDCGFGENNPKGFGFVNGKN